ncbi:hypothetical protein, partial [Corynebacterium diphtheriae]
LRGCIEKLPTIWFLISQSGLWGAVHIGGVFSIILLFELLNQGEKLGDQVDDLGDDIQIRNGRQIIEVHNGPFIRSVTFLVM